MSENKTSRQKRSGLPTRSRSQVVIAVALVLILIGALTMLANSGAFDSALKQKGKQGQPVSLASLNSSSPSKEYIYAGTKLIATVEPTAVNGNDALFVSMSYEEPCSNLGSGSTWLPIGGGSFGLPDPQQYRVRVSMKNTGTTTWTTGSYFLGSQNQANNTTWGPKRVSLLSVQAGTQPGPVPPGQQITFEFGVKKPSGGSGSVNFQWQMVQDPPSAGVFFGEKTSNAVVPGGSFLCGGTNSSLATFVSQTVPSLMFAGQSYPVSITMTNSGSTTWSLAGGYNLGSQLPQDNTYWGINRVALPTSVPPGSNVTFNFNVTAPVTPGAYNFQWMMVQNGVGWFGYLTPAVNVAVNKKAALGYLDFNNDGKTDIATWNSLDSRWHIDYNLDGVDDYTSQFANSRSDFPCPSDYDGDRRADPAVLRPLSGNSAYFLDLNRNGAADPDYPLWRPPGGVPVPGDYDGDGRVDPAVYSSSTNGWWADINHNAGFGVTLTFGASGDIPVPADYNRDGRTDIAVFRPSTGQWLIDTDLNGAADITIAFGQNGDIPLPMDYNGDGIADIAVFRRSTGQWFIDTNLDGVADLVVGYGVSTDIPVPGDYNGDGKVDIAVYRPSTGQWLIDTNNDGVADITVAYSVGSPLRQGGWILKTMGILP